MKKQLLKLCLLNYMDDLNDDNTATLWWFKEGAELNEELHCNDIAQMCTTNEILDLIRGEGVEIEDKRVWDFCTSNDLNQGRENETTE